MPVLIQFITRWGHFRQFSMPRRQHHLGLATASLMLLVGIGLTLASPVKAQTPVLRLAVSIAPLADFVRQVGGDRVAVDVLVPPGQNPHTYTLKPSQMVQISRADAIVFNGLNLETWAERVLDSLNRPQLYVLLAGTGLNERPTVDTLSLEAYWMPLAQALDELHHQAEEMGEAHDDHDDHGHDDHGDEGDGHDDEAELEALKNPHVWLDPLLTQMMVTRIADMLAALDPAGIHLYRGNAERYNAQLQQLHQQFKSQIAHARQQSFVAFHAGYVHLALRYDLVQVGVVGGFTDAEPTPARLAQVLDHMQELGTRVIFTEPQFPQKAARIIAYEGGVELGMLDALGTLTNGGYMAMMEANFKALEQAFALP